MTNDQKVEEFHEDRINYHTAMANRHRKMLELWQTIDSTIANVSSRASSPSMKELIDKCVFQYSGQFTANDILATLVEIHPAIDWNMKYVSARVGSLARQSRIGVSIKRLGSRPAVFHNLEL